MSSPSTVPSSASASLTLKLFSCCLDDMACNQRNAFPGTVYNNADRALDLYGDNIEVDYRGYEVTVENFIRLLTDRLGEDVPQGKKIGQ